MVQRILLGPQSPRTNLRQAVDAIGADGPVVVISAGWRDSEGEIEELREELGRPLEDLMIYHRAEEIFAREPELRDLQRERQDKLKELQELYRIRLTPTLTAARKLMRADGAARSAAPGTTRRHRPGAGAGPPSPAPHPGHPPGIRPAPGAIAHPGGHRRARGGSAAGRRRPAWC